MRGLFGWALGLVLAGGMAEAEIDVSAYSPGAHPLEDFSAVVARFNAGDQLTAGCLFYRGNTGSGSTLPRGQICRPTATPR